MKILITGISGFVGGHLEKLLIENNLDVTGLVRSKKHSLIAKTQLHLVDDIRTCDFNSVTKGYDVVIHLAALVHHPEQDDLKKYMRANHDVTLELAKACVVNGVRKFITLSTCAVYDGNKLTGHIEKDQVFPSTPYAVSKYSATKSILKMKECASTSFYMLRPNLVYGKRGKGNYQKLSSLIAKSSVTPFGAADEKRSYVSVGNLCGFILYLINNNVDSGIYNISDNHDLSTKELCNLIAKAQNKKILQLPFPKWIMKAAFKLMGKKDHYNKIYGEFRLNIDKALATGWKPKPIDYKDFVL